MPSLLLEIAIYSNIKNPIQKIGAIGSCLIVSIVICIIPFKNLTIYLKEGVIEVVEEFIVDIKEYKENLGECNMLMIDTDCSYLLALDEAPLTKYFASQTDLERLDSQVEMIVDGYTSGSVEANVLITTEKGWVGQYFENYILVKVYCKKGGNICVYLPSD